MYRILEYIMDFIFPPTNEEVKIRNISPEDFLKNTQKSGETEFPFISSIFSYKDPLVKELIWQIKYKRNKKAIECASYAIYDFLLEKGFDEAILIPVPISNKRRKERGYNQCELIIDKILEIDLEKRFKKDFSLLTREMDIEKQTFKNREERIKNTKDIFKISKVDFNKNQKIIIIDDVTTTGSTLRESRDVFLKDGFKDVEAITIAH